MSFSLRPYQEDIIARTRGELRQHNSVLIVSATGSGKTALAASMLGSAASKQKRSWFIVHRAELIEQTALTFNKVGIPYGYIAAGMPLNPFMPVQIVSIDTMKNRLGRYEAPDLILWDEAHHACAAGWMRVKEANQQAKHIGLSATPCRLDGKGLGQAFDAMVNGPSVRWLMDNKYLSDYRLYAPAGPDFSKLHTRMGDFVQSEAESLMDRNTLMGDIVRTYREKASGLLSVYYGVSIKHSLHICEAFKESGIRAAHVDGTTPPDQRKRIFQAYARREFDVLCNAALVGEGLDLAAISGLDVTIEAVGLCRPTQSVALYLQMVGRAFRPKEKPALILDHAGNFDRLGAPCDEREWSLADGVGKKSKGAGSNTAMRKCPKCYAVHAPSPKCPDCGHIYVVADRQPEVIDGELIEVDLDAARKRRNLENRQADSLGALIETGKKRGYKKPVHWAAHYHKATRGKMSTLNELMAYAAQQGSTDPVKWAASIMSQIMRK